MGGKNKDEMPPELLEAIPHDVSLYVANFWRHPNDPERPYDFYDDKGEEFFYYLTDENGPLNPHEWGDIVVLLFGRGCLKTTTCTMIANWAMDCFKNIEGIVTAPRSEQTREVMQRFKRAAEDSGLDQRRTRDKETHQQFETYYYDEEGNKRRAYNELKSRSAWGEGDALRGIHAHFGIVDEFQDVDEGMFSVFKETVDRSIPSVPYFPVIFVIGTPKMANTFFHQLWEMSDKREWDDDEKTWYTTNEAQQYLPPEAAEQKKELAQRIKTLKKKQREEGEDHSELIAELQQEHDNIQGFNVTGWHIDQYACPRHSPTDIAFKKATYTKRKFKNEIEAEFYTPENDLIADTHFWNALIEEEGWHKRRRHSESDVYIGVDWGGGDGEGASSTVLWAAEETADGVLETLEVDFFPHDLTPQQELERVEEYILKLDPTCVVVDEGHGDKLRANLQNGDGTVREDGYDMVFGCHYGNVNNKRGVTWARKGDRSYFTVNRTFMIESMVEDFKHSKIKIPKEDLDFSNRNSNGTRLLRELTTPYTDAVETPDGKRKLKVVSDGTDDAFHALTFMWIAANHVNSKRQLRTLGSHNRQGY